MHKPMMVLRVATWVAAATLLAGAVRAAAEPVGRVAALDGQADVQRAGAAEWRGLGAGDDILMGDRVRTQAASRVKLLFRDDSVLTLAANSVLEVNEQVIGAEAPVTRFSLGAGQVRAVVTERYGAPGSRFEMETPTAIAGVRGTSFTAGYDAERDETLVVGLEDRTRVRALIDTAGTRAVVLGPGEATKIPRGGYPSIPAALAEGALRSITRATEMGASEEQKKDDKGARNRAEPRLPKVAGDRTGSPEGRIIDQPVGVLEHGRSGVPPPPPPVPPR